MATGIAALTDEELADLRRKVEADQSMDTAELRAEQLRLLATIATRDAEIVRLKEQNAWLTEFREGTLRDDPQED